MKRAVWTILIYDTMQKFEFNTYRAACNYCNYLDMFGCFYEMKKDYYYSEEI